MLIVTRILVAVLVASLATEVVGQETKPLDRHRAKLERQIALSIRNIKRVCQLTPAQGKRILLAGKGAISASIAKYNAATARLKKLIAPPAEDGAKEEDAANFDIDKAFDVVMDFAYEPKNKIPNVTDEPRWKKTLQTVLSDKQRAAYEESVAEREAFLRDTAVANFIGKVDRKLFLSIEQRQKLTAVIDKEFGEQLSRISEGDDSDGIWFEMQPVDEAPIAHADLKFLSESQLVEWKQTVESALASIQIEQAPVFSTTDLLMHVVPKRFWEEAGIGPIEPAIRVAP